MMSKYSNPRSPSPATSSVNGAETNPGEEQIRVNGFAQVLEMLKIADPEFRMSLLRRLSAKDPELGRQLKADLRNLGLV